MTLEAALLADTASLLAALESWLPLRGSTTATYVVRSRQQNEAAGFIQARQRLGRPEADLLYIAPAPCTEATAPLWEQLLASVASWAGMQGLLRLYASAPADSAEEAALRRSGYLRYAADTVFRLEKLPEPLPPLSQSLLRPQKQRDVWGLQRLYAAITPLRVQQAEGLIHNGWGVPTSDWNGQAWTKSLVLEDSNGLQAHLGLRRGRRGHYFRLVTRAELADRQGELLVEALTTLAQWPPLPIYCSVRHYQNGLARHLQELGFVPFQERALTVRHAVLSVRPALEEVVLKLQGAVGAGCSSSIGDNGKTADGSAALAVFIPSALEREYDKVPDYR
ncbi:MAG: hypothetical protein ACUVWR_09130 [Anaerolineae bacterium]